MQVSIYTQIYENYGYRWKPKGGDHYVIEVDSRLPQNEINRIVMDWAREALPYNDMFQEYPVDWDFDYPDYDEVFEYLEKDSDLFDADLEYIDYLDSIEDQFKQAA